MKRTENWSRDHSHPGGPFVHSYQGNNNRSNQQLSSFSNSNYHTQAPQPLSAAQIALGRASPFSARLENGTPKVMAHDSNQYLLRPPRLNNKPRRVETNPWSETSTEGDICEEENTSRTSDTVLITSPGRMTPQDDASEAAGVEGHRVIGGGIGTPSTVSTAPSTDDASHLTDYKLEDAFLPNLLQGSPGHSRSSSWGDDGLLPITNSTPTLPHHLDGPDIWPNAYRSNPLHSQSDIGHASHQTQEARVASFRGSTHATTEIGNQPREPWFHHQRLIDRPTHEHPYADRPRQASQSDGTNRQNISNSPHFERAQLHNRRVLPPHFSGGHTMPLQATPPRPRSMRPNNIRAPFPTNPSSTHQHPHGQGSQRSSSEILKTLLRKKACLYEPDTSRAVALITWLVGRELALEYGFFSRQQLQAGVHACVSRQIDSGNITRTKVNRCMQIILNSCFHYIIPRSDGTEESGDTFKAAFAQKVAEDSSLLSYLPSPWSNLVVNRELVLDAAQYDTDDTSTPKPKGSTTPKSSPKHTSSQPPSPVKDLKDHDDNEAKRAVLLCFNENVRSAEDVFRCHNEFIRDTANAAGLQLGAMEWRNFFGHEAAGAPFLWGDVGIPVPFEGRVNQGPRTDVFGHMSENELAKFRTTWCAKRYEHDHELCSFAHVEMNGGWLRRNSKEYQYSDTMCTMISTVQLENGESLIVNVCPHGRMCRFAHSREEVLFHPNRYKTQVCKPRKPGACFLGDVCPHLHELEAIKGNRRNSDGRLHSPRHTKRGDMSPAHSKINVAIPASSPIIYASPAPLSDFDRFLGMPGLRNLFRRQCSVVKASLYSSNCQCVYSTFGDDWGITEVPEKSRQYGLPQPPPRS